MPNRSDRDPDDDARARAWADEMRELAEAGRLPDENDYLEKALAEEKRKLKRR